MKDLPRSLLGGNSPVVAYLRHSMMVCGISRVWGNLGWAGVLEAYRLPRAVETDNERERTVELDCLADSVVERADAAEAG